MGLLIQLLTGALGGNIAGKLLSKFNMGTLWNSIVGILGGGIGGQLLAMLGLGTTGLEGTPDLNSVIGSVASGTAGGGVLMAIVGFIKSAMGSK